MPGRPDVLASPLGRRALFALLYFAEGAPIGYVWWALPTRLREAGVPVEQVTAMSALLTLPWAFKFVWAPLVDALRPRRAGLRAWITGAQLAMGATLLPIVGLDIARHYGFLLACLLAHAVAAATQDVAIDALAVRCTPREELGSITGWMQIGMLAGRAGFGGVALVVEAQVGARAVVIALIALVWASSLIVWLADEPPLDREGGMSARMSQFGSMAGRVFSSRTTWLGLAVAATGGAAMEATGIVAGPLLIDLGIAKEGVGRFFAGPAVVCMGVGALLGGRLSDRLVGHAGLSREHFLTGAIFAVALGVVVTGSSLGSVGESSHTLAVSLLAVDYLLFGIYTAAAYALFMSLTDPQLGGTQFSAFMGGINLCSVWSGWAVGQLASDWGYPTALWAMGLASFVAWPLLVGISRSERRRAYSPLRCAAESPALRPKKVQSPSDMPEL